MESLQAVTVVLILVESAFVSRISRRQDTQASRCRNMFIDIFPSVEVVGIRGAIDILKDRRSAFG